MDTSQPETDASRPETGGQSLGDKRHSHKASASEAKSLLFVSCLFFCSCCVVFRLLVRDKSDHTN